MDTIRDLPEAQDKSAESLTGAAEGFFTKFKMGTILNRSGITKTKGISHYCQKEGFKIIKQKIIDWINPDDQLDCVTLFEK